MDNNQIDPRAQQLVKAIAAQEGGGKFLDYGAASGDEPNAPKGTAGGRYQFTADTWKKYAGQVLGDANSPLTPDNQNKVAYTKVKSWLDSGKTPAQAASMWNAGEGAPDAWKPGTKQAHGDTPTYVKNVQKYGQQLSQTQTSGVSVNGGYPTTKLDIPANISTQTAPGDVTGSNSFIGDVSNTLGQAGTGIGNAVNQTLSGQINPLSGLIQGVGAAAGGVSGLLMNTAEHLPVVGGIVKGAEGLAGQAIGAAAQTPIGQQIAGGVQTFTQQHPELAGDIGGIANIAGLVGGGWGGVAGKGLIEKGVYNAAKEGVLGAGAKGLVEKSATKTATKILETAPTVNSVKAAVRSGRVSSEGGLAADPLKEASIKEITPMVKEGILKDGKPIDNALAIKAAADQTAIEMRNALRNQEIQNVLQPEQLQSMTQNVLKKAGEGLPSGENPAQSLLNVFYKALPQSGDITAEHVLNARQAVSRFVLENRGDWSMRGVMTGFKTARDAIWDESRTLLSDMAPNVPVRQMLERQTNLYRALDYLPAAIKKELTAEKRGAIAQYLARHPIQKFVGKELGRGALIGLGIPYGEHLLGGL